MSHYYQFKEMCISLNYLYTTTIKDLTNIKQLKKNHIDLKATNKKELKTKIKILKPNICKAFI